MSFASQIMSSNADVASQQRYTQDHVQIDNTHEQHNLLTQVKRRRGTGVQ